MLVENQNVFDAAETASTEASAGTETDTSASSTETTETPAGQGGEEGGEIPKDLNNKTALHKEARFKRVIEERNRLRRELEDARKTQQERPQTATKSAPDGKRPTWFTKFYGEGPEADDAWEGLNQLAESKKDAAIEAMKQEQRQASQESERWNGWVAEQVEALEDEGESFDRNALFKVMDEFRPTDDEGNLDFRRGLELMRMKNAKPSSLAEKRKAGALAGTSVKNGTETAKKNYVTPKDIARMRATGEI